jgi:hypothetical protein
MIFERVKNGNGKIFGSEAFVCPESYIDRVSFVADKADVWKSRLIKSKATGDARIRASLLEYSDVASEVVQSHLMWAKVSGGSILGSYVENSVIEGGNIRGAKVIDCTVRDNAVVEKGAIVKGFTLDKKMRISTGVWLRPPRYFEIDNEIAQIGITESSDGYAMIGCTRKKMSAWIKKRTLWIKSGGWTEQMGLDLEEIFSFWLDTPMEMN